jgi:hypothetical protein
VCSPLLHSSDVHVDDEERDYDHLLLFFDLSISSTISFSAPPKPQKWTCKHDWGIANWSLYLSTLALLLSNISVSFHLLGACYFISDVRGQLNAYYRNIISSIKQAEAIAVPFIRVRLNTRKTFWKCDPELKKVKNQAKFWLKLWIACDRPSSGQVFSIKQKTKSAYKRHLRAVRFSGAEFPSNGKQWKSVLNASKLEDSFSSDIIPRLSWINHYTRFFSGINYAVHSCFSALLAKVLPNRVSQRHIIPVEKSNIVKSLRRLKSKACDLDSICAAHLDPRSTELVSHLQLLFQMCLSRSIVPDSFLCGSVTSILKKGKDLHSCNS